MKKLTTEWQEIKSLAYTHSSGAKVTFYLDAKVGTSDIVNNKTAIFTRLNSVLVSGSMSGYNYKFTCSYAPEVKDENGVWNFATETITETNTNQYVQHDDDGTKKVTLTATIFNNYLGINETISEEVELPTIARKSKVSCASPFNIQDNVTINISSKNDDFTHTIRYSFEDSEEVVLASNIKTTNNLYQLNWATPITMYTQGDMENKSSGTGYLTVETFSGDTSLGVSDKFNFTANVTNSEPEIQIFSLMEHNSNIVDNYTGGQAFIKGISSADVTVAYSLKNGATLKELYVTCSDGQKLNLSSTVLTGTIHNIKGNVFTLHVKDSRKFETTQVITKAMKDYFNPYSSKMNIARTEQTSAEIKATIEGKFWNDNFGIKANTLKYSYRTRESGENWSDFTDDVSITSSDNNFTISDLSLGTNFSTSKQYDIQFRLKDEIGYYNLNIENVTESVGLVDFYEDMIDFQVPVCYQDKQLICKESVTDCNAISTERNFNISTYPTKASNSPTGANGVIFSFVPSQEYIYQLALVGSNPTELYTRARYIGTWGNWRGTRWKEDAVIDSTNNTITIPVSWDDLQEISFRVLGTDQASFGYLTAPKEFWHNNGAYELQINCFDYNGNYKGYKQFKVITKNTHNFVIAMSGTAGGVKVVYR